MESFNRFFAVDSSNTDPAYTKEILDAKCGAGVSYDDFAAFVGDYSFEAIAALK